MGNEKQRKTGRGLDAGASHLISQLFFDNADFYRFRDLAEKKGIHIPIEAGIMPVVNARQILRMVSLCGASLPPKFTRMISRYEDKPAALRDAGIAYAIDQIVDLIAQGVQGIHLYTMNDPDVARRISQAELADAVDVTRQTIISLEGGRYNASLLLAHKIAKYFGLTIEEVFLFEEEET